MKRVEEASQQRERPAVLVVTHLPSRREEIHATLLGAIGYLTKPVTFEQLAPPLAPSAAYLPCVPCGVGGRPSDSATPGCTTAPRQTLAPCASASSATTASSTPSAAIFSTYGSVAAVSAN